MNDNANRPFLGRRNAESHTHRPGERERERKRERKRERERKKDMSDCHASLIRTTRPDSRHA